MHKHNQYLKSVKVAILTISDRASDGVYKDLSGPALQDLTHKALNAEVVESRVIPDDQETITQWLRQWADRGDIDLILTTGGTGFTARDVTPEATREVIEREAPGLAEAMRAASLKVTPHAMLSRAVAGIRGKTLILNLPGSPKGARENLSVVLPALPHAIALLRGEPADMPSRQA